MEIEKNQNAPVKEKLWWEIELEMQEKQEKQEDLRIRIDDPKTYLVNVTAACLLQESKYYDENDERRQIMTQALLKVSETDPEFVCQLGVYVRNELYIRTTSNYIAAFCTVHPKTQPFIEKYFNKIILLPNDLLETCEFAQVLYIFAATEFTNLHLHHYLNKNVRSELTFRNVLQRCVRSKFLEFNDYQLGKYCTDSQRKKKNFAYLAVTNVEKWNEVRAEKRRKLLQKMQAASKPEVLASSSDAVQASAVGIHKKIAKRGKAMKKAGKTARIAASTLDAKYLTFKDLIAFCHISQPKLRVFKILGKKYPATEEEYAKTFSDVEVAKEPFDATKVGKRMKIEISTTWETELSSKGNSALVWENLITSNQIPYLALIRNLSNILRAGVSDAAHNLVISKLQEPKAVENSKVFPLQFFSSILAVSEAVTKGFKAKKDESAPLADQLESVKKFVKKDESTRMKEEEEAKEAEQYIKVNPETGKLYIEALERAIKVAVNKNLEQIEGNTAIFADVSGSMNSPISGGSRAYGTIRTCLDCALVLGLMIKQRSAKSSFYIFSSPGVQYKKCFLPVDLPGDDLKPSIEKIQQEKEKLGGGTDFPYECIDEWRTNKVHYDNVVFLSDMMIAQGYSDIAVRGKSIVDSVNQYKNEINPNLKIFAVDLESKGKCLNLGDEFNENNYIKIFGMSDSILKFISSKKGGFNQVEFVKEFALKKITENAKQ